MAIHKFNDQMDQLQSEVIKMEREIDADQMKIER